jgi:outer membrane protein insertion porin family
MFPSDYDYSRLLLDFRRYQELAKLVIAMRLKFGAVNSNDDSGFVPVEDRFYAGGAMSLRGWSRSTLGPLRQNGNPIGGKSLIEASIELRYPIIGIVSGVVFTDFGNVWLPAFTYKLDNLRYSGGIGVRVSTPIGPIRLDVAWPVDDRETGAQFHLNVGHAF